MCKAAISFYCLKLHQEFLPKTMELQAIARKTKYKPLGLTLSTQLRNSRTAEFFSHVFKYFMAPVRIKSQAPGADVVKHLL